MVGFLWCLLVGSYFCVFGHCKKNKSWCVKNCCCEVSFQYFFVEDTRLESEERPGDDAMDGWREIWVLTQFLDFSKKVAGKYAPVRTCPVRR